MIGIVDSRTGKRIAIEIKTGFSTNPPELARYLLNCDVLIVVRLKTGQVVKLRPEDYEQFLREDLRDLILKMRRIVEGKPVAVRCQSCKGCHVDCRFAEPTRNSSRQKVVVNGTFAEDLVHTFRNVYTILDEVISLVVEELRPPSQAGP